MMADERLDRVLAKIERAKKHIGDLEDRVKIFLDDEPYEIVRDNKSHPNLCVFRLTEIAPMPTDIPLILGDAVHNLRSALDHLMWQLIEANGQTPTMRTQFPIFSDPKTHKAMDQRKVQGVSQAALDLIDRIQPYKSGDYTLTGLQELDNIDKHRSLLTIGHANSSVVLNLEVSGVSLPAIEHTNVGVKVGTVLYVGPSHGPASELHQAAQFTFFVAFAEPEVFKGQPILPGLHQIADFIDSIAWQFRNHL